MKFSLKHKYHAKACQHDGKKFRSKLERSVWLALENLREKEKLLFTLREVGVDLPGGVRHYIDFLSFGQGECWFLEAKAKAGRAPVGELKRKQAEEILGVQIHVVTDPKEVYSLILTTH